MVLSRPEPPETAGSRSPSPEPRPVEEAEVGTDYELNVGSNPEPTAARVRVNVNVETIQEGQEESKLDDDTYAVVDGDHTQVQRRTDGQFETDVGADDLYDDLDIDLEAKRSRTGDDKDEENYLHISQFDLDTPVLKRSRSSRRRESILSSTPVYRRHMQFVKAGLRQSLGKHTLRDTGVDDDEEKEREDSYSYHELEAPRGLPIIDGREMPVAVRPKDISEFAPIRMWDKTEREDLPADIRQTFVKAATGYVLPKSNKLTTPNVVTQDSQLLVHVSNLHSQLKIIKAHLKTYDLYDVMTIVIPVDVKHTMKLETRQYDLMDDYAQLHAVHVANSCVQLTLCSGGHGFHLVLSPEQY